MKNLGFPELKFLAQAKNIMRCKLVGSRGKNFEHYRVGQKNKLSVTYKMQLGTETYDTSKLFAPKNSCNCVSNKLKQLRKHFPYFYVLLGKP